MSDFPGKLTGTHPLVPWLNSLREACISARVTSVVNGTMTRGPGGTSIVCGKLPSGQLIYIKACLEDGSECYVPLSVMGVIYELNTGTVTAPTINAGSVPDGSTVLG